MKKVIIGLLSSVLVIASCTKEEKKVEERVFDINVNMENDFLNIETTKKQYHAHGGEFYSGIDSIQMYGAGYSKKIEDSLKGYNLDIYISVWLREKAPSEGGIAISLNTKDKVKDWQLRKIKPELFKSDEWIELKDTVRYNVDMLKDATEIRIFSMKTNGADILGSDDLRIKYKFYK